MKYFQILILSIFHCFILGDTYAIDIKDNAALVEVSDVHEIDEVKGVVKFGFSEKSVGVWTSFKVVPEEEGPEQIELSLEYTNANFIYLFRKNKERLDLVAQSGMLNPQSFQDDIGFTNYMDFEVSGSSEYIIYVGNIDGYAPDVKIKLTNSEVVQKQQDSRLIVDMLIIGAGIIMFAFTLVMFLFHLDNRSYLYVSLFILGFLLYSLSMKGYFIALFFSSNPLGGWAFNESFYHFAFIGSFLFIREYFQFSERQPRGERILNILIIVTLCKAIFCFIYLKLTYDSHGLLLFNMAALVVEIVLPVVLVFKMWNQLSLDQKAILYTGGFYVLVAIARVYVWSYDGFQTYRSLSNLSDASMIIGFMMFIVAISIRNKKVFEERNLAHAKINSLQRIKNKELELEVERRTNEIREINLDLAVKNKSLDARNEEIETLLHEVHHRVKNNFQLVESLLDIQGRQTNVDQANLLEKSKNRIRSMALVHEQLYSNTGSEVNFKDYLIDLTDGISSSMAPEQPLIEVEMEDVILSLEKSIPLGLIVNELIMNAYRHAQLGESDLIRVTLSRQGNKYHLKVVDNGIGIANYQENPSFEEGMGLWLVSRLVRQLRGELRYVNAKGSIFNITF